MAGRERDVGGVAGDVGVVGSGVGRGVVGVGGVGVGGGDGGVGEGVGEGGGGEAAGFRQGGGGERRGRGRRDAAFGEFVFEAPDHAFERGVEEEEAFWGDRVSGGVGGSGRGDDLL